MKSTVSLWFVVAAIVVAVTTVWADTVTPVEQCQGESFENLRDKINITPCGKTRCKLPKNKDVTVVFRFTPKKAMDHLYNEVRAVMGGITLPFIGVNGTSACEHLVLAETGAPASCPLSANQEYLYTNVFPILPQYPPVSVRVHWHLHDGNDIAICFEVPAVIAN